MRAGCLTVLAVVVMAVPMWSQTTAPDTVFFDGNILTGTRLRAGDPSATPGHVTAMAVLDGKIVAVGSDEEVLALKG
jgi:predicted amidohydrolase YtcJ